MAETTPTRRKEGETFSVSKQVRVPPAVQYVRSLDGEYYLLTEVADMVKVSDQTLRKLIKASPPKVKAPSYVGSQGDMKVYLFTPEDVEEIKTYFHAKYENFEARGKGRPKKKVK